MSCEAVELALYDLGVRKDARVAFAQDADGFLNRYNLTPEEAARLRDFDVGAMLRAGASPLLLIGFWMTNHPERSRAAYLERVRAAQT